MCDGIVRFSGGGWGVERVFVVCIYFMKNVRVIVVVGINFYDFGGVLGVVLSWR